MCKTKTFLIEQTISTFLMKIEINHPTPFVKNQFYNPQRNNEQNKKHKQSNKNNNKNPLFPKRNNLAGNVSKPKIQTIV